jgi:pimeloyl-ACP methyl ester carboxylesterase
MVTAAMAATIRRKSVALVLVVTLLFALSASLVRPHPALAAATCQQARLPVALGLGRPLDQVVAGTFCVPPSYGGRPPQVDVMVHGGTYNRAYWDFPTSYPAYSYLHRTLGEHRAAFAYDRLGAGASSRPLSLTVTASVEAYVLHQVVQWLRGQGGFGVVNVVGHSFGSVIAVAEAATYNDVNALVLTGYLHAQGPATFRVTDLYPAALDPRFAGQGYDLGYLTSRPGIRAALFYYSTADPAVVLADEATKDVMSSALFSEGMTQLSTPAPANLSDRVTTPVLLVAGQHDLIYCGLLLDCASTGTVRAHEAAYFASAASLDVYMVADAGHDVALHPSAQASFDVIDGWLDARV